MPHFLIKKEEIKDGFIDVTNHDTFFHIARVLRVKTGEKIKFIDENQNIYVSEIIKINKMSLMAKIIESYKTSRVLKTNICLIQSVLANDAQNLLIANATQTGLKEIYPVISDNVTVSVNSVKNKTEKWQKIVNENFKQCERGDIAQIHPTSKLSDVLSNFKKENVLIFAEKYAGLSLNNCLNNIAKDEPIAVVIGPEGGFSEREFDCFKKNGYKLITLGKMIYKAPNAVVAAVSNIISRIESDEV